MIKKVAPTKVTGGGGFEFEDKVTAFFLCYLLDARPPLDPSLGIIKRLDFQVRADGWLFDDLLLTLENGNKKKRCAFSIKSNPQFSKTTIPQDVAENLWAQYLGENSKVFQKDTDKIGLITAPLDADTRTKLNDLIHKARSQDSQNFFNRIQVDGYVSQEERSIFESFSCPRTLAKKYSIGKSNIGELLKCFEHLQFDFEQTSSYNLNDAILLLKNRLESNNLNEANALWDTLCAIARTKRSHGGYIDSHILISDIRKKYRLKDFPNHATLWENIKRETITESRTLVGDAANIRFRRFSAVRFPPRIVDITRLTGSCASILVRKPELKALNSIWHEGTVRLVNIVGAPGSGRTTLLNYWLGGMKKHDMKGANIFACSFLWNAGNSPNGVSADAFFHGALRTFGYDGPIPVVPAEKGELLAELIEHRRTLLVLDDIDFFQERTGMVEGNLRLDSGLAHLIRRLLLHDRGLCVVSSTHALTEYKPFRTRYRGINLCGLTPIKGATFLQSLGATKGSHRDRQVASQELHGNPGALALLAGILTDRLEGDVRRRPEVDSSVHYDDHTAFIIPIIKYYEQASKQSTELFVLRVLSFFDRPASKDEITVLKRLSDLQPQAKSSEGVSEQEWNQAISRLLRMNFVERYGEHFALNPLVRNYFRRKIIKGFQDMWRTGNSMLYQYYAQTTVERPRTYADVQSVITGIVHACRAGEHQKALDGLFISRLRQIESQYSIHQLGAWTEDWHALSQFFDVVPTKPHTGLTSSAKAYVLKEAGFSLWAFGYLSDAAPLLESAAHLYESKQDWANAARCAGNLSALLLSLGKLKTAEAQARRAIKLADKSQQQMQRITRRANLACVLHQMGKIEEAEKLFEESENLQVQEQPESCVLYARSGLQYCDLLLDKAEVLLNTSPSGVRDFLTNIKVRAETMFRLIEQDKARYWTLTDLVLNHLTLGRIALMEKRFGLSKTLATAKRHICAAVTKVQVAGRDEGLPVALLAEATLYRSEHRIEKTETCLRKALIVCQTHGIRLREADILLEYGFLRAEQGRVADALSYLETAESIITSCGYYRRRSTAAMLRSLCAGYQLGRSGK